MSKSQCEQSVWVGGSVAANFGEHTLTQMGNLHEQMSCDDRQRGVEGAI